MSVNNSVLARVNMQFSKHSTVFWFGYSIVGVFSPEYL